MDTYDIHFEVLPPDQQRQGKPFSFVYARAAGVKGAQKLVNRWLKCFLTKKGSDPISPSYGTGFSGLFGTNIGDLRALKGSIELFIDDCNTQIRALDIKNRPPADEKLASAALASLTPTGDSGIEVYIHIRNTAGTLATVALPSITSTT